MKIRDAKKSDCKSCVELSKIKELLGADGKPIELEYFEEVSDSPKSIFIVAEEEGKVIGYSSADLVPGKLSIWWLLAVDPAHQNQGIGKELFEEIENRCKERGAKWILGYAPPYNEKTLSFHKKNGFVFGQKFFEMVKKIS